MPSKGVRFRVRRTGKTTGVRLGFRGNKVVEHKKLTGLKPKKRGKR